MPQAWGWGEGDGIHRPTRAGREETPVLPSSEGGGRNPGPGPRAEDTEYKTEKGRVGDFVVTIIFLKFV